jgi:hypothetical protein
MIVLDAFTGNYTAHRFITTKDLYPKVFTFENFRWKWSIIIACSLIKKNKF